MPLAQKRFYIPVLGHASFFRETGRRRMENAAMEARPGKKRASMVDHAA
jgi:hypothetical protein